MKILDYVKLKSQSLATSGVATVLYYTAPEEMDLVVYGYTTALPSPSDFIYLLATTTDELGNTFSPFSANVNLNPNSLWTPLHPAAGALVRVQVINSSAVTVTFDAFVYLLRLTDDE